MVLVDLTGLFGDFFFLAKMALMRNSANARLAVMIAVVMLVLYRLIAK
jgi:hypothetical protein